MTTATAVATAVITSTASKYHVADATVQPRPTVRMRPVGSVIRNPWALLKVYRNRNRMTIAEFVSPEVTAIRTIKVSVYRHACKVAR